jgi:hypothetical protein
MDHQYMVVVAAAAICIQQLLAAYMIIFDDVLTASEARAAKKRKHELTPYKRNLSVVYGTPTTELEHIPALERILQDINRPYMKNVTHLHGWQCFDFAAHLQPLIDRPRLQKDGTQPLVNLHKKTKADHYHDLYYCLKWLNDSNFFRTREAEIDLGKSTIHEDTVHVLEAIVEGLDDQFQWPDAEKRQELASVFPGMFHGCVGIADVKEYQVVKYLDPVKERRSWSGKKEDQQLKLLSVKDHSGRYIYTCVCLGKNDCEVFTSSPLYLSEGDYFLDDEFVAAAGAFEGDCRLKCSYKNPGNDEVEKLWNLAFRERRTGVENSYQQTGAWFPLLGNNKHKLPYLDRVLFLAIHTAIRLHNYIMNTEHLSYFSLESVDNIYINYLEVIQTNFL